VLGIPLAERSRGCLYRSGRDAWGAGGGRDARADRPVLREHRHHNDPRRCRQERGQDPIVRDVSETGGKLSW